MKKKQLNPVNKEYKRLSTLFKSIDASKAKLVDELLKPKVVQVIDDAPVAKNAVVTPDKPAQGQETNSGWTNSILAGLARVLRAVNGNTN